MKKRLLLISNSTNYGESYLEWPQPYIKDFLDKKGIKSVLFIPYAGVALSEESPEESYDIYEERVNSVFLKLGLEVYSIHREKNPIHAVKDALAIAVGGGNTFHLVHKMHELRLMDAIRNAVESGVSFMGWSAGANVACPSLMTTNDMPIIEPKSFETLNLVSFQINPHFIEASLEGHGGETREQRLEEFMILNKNIPIVGLRESSALFIKGDHIELQGHNPLRYFKFGRTPKDYNIGDDISFLLK